MAQRYANRTANKTSPDKRKIGDLGEQLAQKFLEAKGYELITRQHRCGRLEIDLIMREGNALVFVEVKARAHNGYGFPESAVNEKKRSNILKAAEAFTYERHWEGPIRFDIVAVTFRPQLSIKHFQDVF